MSGLYDYIGVGAPFGRIVSGTKTVTTAGTAVQITATSTPTGIVWVAADLGNTNPVVVGDSSVVAASGSMQGIVLTPGNNSIPVNVNNLNLLWVDSQTNGDKLTYSYLQPYDGI